MRGRVFRKFAKGYDKRGYRKSIPVIDKECDCSVNNEKMSYNDGGLNIGDLNIGKENVGNMNIGVGNSGYCNVGHCNTGYCNFGNNNVGSFNKGDGVYGVFCTEPQKIRLFNKETDMTMEEFINSPYCDALISSPLCLTELMDTEMGKLRKLVQIDFKEACKEWWDNIGDENKNTILSMPNFDAKLFEEITGIDTL